MIAIIAAAKRKSGTTSPIGRGSDIVSPQLGMPIVAFRLPLIPEEPPDGLSLVGADSENGW